MAPDLGPPSPTLCLLFSSATVVLGDPGAVSSLK